MNTTLSNDKFEELKKIGLARLRAKYNDSGSARITFNNRYDQKQTDEDVDLSGIVSEFAVADYLGLALDTSISARGDDGNDLKDDRTIQVKSTKYPTGKLLFDNFGKFVSDVAFLVIVSPDFKTTRIAGWISKQDFLAKAQTKDFGYGSRVFVSQSELNSADTFKGK